MAGERNIVGCPKTPQKTTDPLVKRHQPKPSARIFSRGNPLVASEMEAPGRRIGASSPGSDLGAGHVLCAGAGARPGAFGVTRSRQGSLLWVWVSGYLKLPSNMESVPFGGSRS